MVLKNCKILLTVEVVLTTAETFLTGEIKTIRKSKCLFQQFGFLNVKDFVKNHSVYVFLEFCNIPFLLCFSFD
jgi:hypothetical protein